MDRSLGILEELTPHPRLREITGDLLRSVRGGSALSDALAKHHPRPFSRLYINMVRAGEKGGFLEATLKRLAEFLRESQEFREAVVSASIYPALLTLVGAGAVVFLLTFVIPRFGEIFRGPGPGPAAVDPGAPRGERRACRPTGGWGRWPSWRAILAVRMALANPAGRLAMDQAALRPPLAGPVVLKGEMARFARVLGTLLQSGVPVVTALAVVRRDARQPGARQRGGPARRGRAPRRRPLHAHGRGRGLSRSLARHMVRIGEETGKLDEMLLRVAAAFEADVRKAVKRLVGLLEPCIILAHGPAGRLHRGGHAHGDLLDQRAGPVAPSPGASPASRRRRSSTAGRSRSS